MSFRERSTRTRKTFSRNKNRSRGIFLRERFFLRKEAESDLVLASKNHLLSFFFSQNARSMKKLLISLATFSAILAGGCNATNYDSKEERLTVAKAQREIKIGMPSADVVEVLGSPNMVTTDAQRRETWVYDKVSTNVSSSQTESGVWLLIATVGGSSSRSSSNQRTLTIIVKFDENNLVRDFAYRTSTF